MGPASMRFLRVLFVIYAFGLLVLTLGGCISIG